MNKLYINNLRYLSQLNKKFKKDLEAVRVSSVFIKESKDEEKNIFTLYKENEVAIHSNYYPRKQARFIAEDALKDSPDVVFLFGLGLGYELKEMIKLNNTTRYFIIEPNIEIFKKSLEVLDIKFLFNNNNIFFILDNRCEYIINFFETLVYNDKTVNIKFVVLPTYYLIYNELINEIERHINEIINKIRINIRTINLSNRAWCQAFMANLKHLKSSCTVEKLKPIFKNVPAIIVAAGPSLNYNIDKLKEINGKAIVAAVGTGIQILEANNIRADLVGAIDVWKSEEELFHNLKLNRDIPLLYSSHISYNIPSMMPGPKFLMNCGLMDTYINENLHWEKFNIFTGPSIANTIAYNLSELGCNPIIFLGQDMCISEESWYAKGAKNNIDFTKEELEKQGYIKTKNKKNKDVYTLSAFLGMKTSMEKCIEQHPDIKYFNGTEDGLEIKGAENINFNTYVDESLNIENQMIGNKIKQVYNEQIENYDKKVINEFIECTKKYNDNIIYLIKGLLLVLSGDSSEKEKIQHINYVENLLTKNEFFSSLVKTLVNEIEFVYQSKPYLERIEQQYAYILDKCLIMENAFVYEVYQSQNNIN